MNLSRLRAQSKIKRLIADEAGTVALDYGMIASVMAVALIAGLTPVGSNLGSSFKAAADAILAARSAGSPLPAAAPPTAAPAKVAPIKERRSRN